MIERSGTSTKLLMPRLIIVPRLDSLALAPSLSVCLLLIHLLPGIDSRSNLTIARRRNVTTQDPHIGPYLRARVSRLCDV